MNNVTSLINVTSNFVIQKGLDCEVKANEIIIELVKDYQTGLLISVVGMMCLVVVYFLLEFYRHRTSKKCNDIEKIVKVSEWVGFLQRGLVFLMFILVSRLLQYAVWSL